MNLLYFFLVYFSTAVFASDAGVQTSRRKLWWWANEPRFIMGPKSYNDWEGPNKALGVPSPHNYGQEVILMDRDIYDRYQKFRLQDTKEGVYIRFDNHPQPGIRTRDEDNKIEMYNADWDSHGEWAIGVLYIRQNNMWVDPREPLVWTAEAMSQIGRMLVYVYNREKEAYLRIKDGRPEMIKIDVEADKDNLMDPDWLRAQKLEWEIEYVTNQYTAGAVAIMVLAPAALAATVATGGAISGAVGAAMISTFGFASIPVMQAIGAAAVSTSSYVGWIIVGGLIKKYTIGVEAELSLGDMDRSGYEEPAQGYGYSIANEEDLVMKYGVYGLALVGLMTFAYGVYKCTCRRSKTYVEFQEIDAEA